MEHSFGDGKYTVKFHPDGKLTALRNGEPWDRDLTGDKLVYCMLSEVDKLKGELKDFQDNLNVKRMLALENSNTELQLDKERLDWVLPIITGEDDDTANNRTVVLAACLMGGLTGRDAIDAARKAVGK